MIVFQPHGAFRAWSVRYNFGGETMAKTRHLLALWVGLTLANALGDPALAVVPEVRVEQLEILRTDPATARTPEGQWTLTRDDARLDDFIGARGGGWGGGW